MKIILSKDIKKLGRKGEVREVSNGYAMNFLVPEGLANIYNASMINQAAKPKTKAKTKK